MDMDLWKQIEKERGYCINLARKFLSAIGLPVHYAEDCVQDVMIDAFKYIKSYNPRKGSISTWLGLMMRSNVIDLARKEASHNRRIETAKSLALLDCWGERISECLISQDVMTRLSENERTVILMIADGWTIRDTARIIGMDEARCYRMRSLIKDHLCSDDPLND